MTGDNVTTLKWETPTSRGQSRAKWPSILAELQTKPGEWAIVYEGPGGEAENKSRNRRNSLMAAAMPRGVKLETATRLVDGVVKVYARVIS